MVGWAFLILCCLIALVIGGKYLLDADPRKLAKGLHYLLLGAIFAVALFFAVTGRFAFGLGALFFAIPYARRVLFPSWAGLAGLFQFPNWSRSARPSAGKNSTVETAYLSMTLSHDRGEMDGEVLQGKFAGKVLRDLSRSQLFALYEECLIEDPEAATLMEAYLDRSLGESWRNEAGAGQQEDGSAKDGKRRGWGRAGNSQMTIAEARNILGVSTAASEAEIKDAHRQLMLKNHPDRGGSDVLAAKLIKPRICCSEIEQNCRWN